MPWYHWIGTYMIIIGGMVFTVFPEKTWHMWLLCIIGILGGMAIVAFTPANEHIHMAKYCEKYKNKNQEGE